MLMGDFDSVAATMISVGLHPGPIADDIRRLLSVPRRCRDRLLYDHPEVGIEFRQVALLAVSPQRR